MKTEEGYRAVGDNADASRCSASHLCFAGRPEEFNKIISSL